MSLFKNKSGEPRGVIKFFKNLFKNMTPQIGFVLGIIAGVAIFSTVSFVLLYGAFLKTVQMQNLVYMAGAPEEQLEDPEDAAPTAPEEAQPEEPEVHPENLSPITKDDYVLGNFDAPLTMILFTDFQCPYCAKHGDTINQIAEEYPNDVRVVLRQFPLGFHDQAQKAAEATECAGEQGKFWEMHDKVFALNKAGTMSVENFKKAAEEIGLDSAQFNSCLDEGVYAQKVEDDYQEGIAAGVRGTPATFINGKLVSGAVPYEQFKMIIDSELE